MTITKSRARVIARRAVHTACNGYHLSPSDYISAAWSHLSERSQAMIEREVDRIGETIDPSSVSIRGERWKR